MSRRLLACAVRHRANAISAHEAHHVRGFIAYANEKRASAAARHSGDGTDGRNELAGIHQWVLTGAIADKCTAIRCKNVLTHCFGMSGISRESAPREVCTSEPVGE